LEFNFRLVVPELVHRATHQLVEAAELGSCIGKNADHHITSIDLVSLAAHIIRLFESIHHAGNGPRRQARKLGEPTGQLHLAIGFFVPSTLFRDVKPRMRIAREEIFGPVSVVIPFDTFEDALQISNDTDFGLIAAVYTASSEKGFRAARRLDTGVVFLNNHYRSVLERLS
jgi:acyl-CoA reductase-like NAD-dependent aldehyde dehydrogenase